MNRFGTLSGDMIRNEKCMLFYVDRNYMDSVFEISSFVDMPQEAYDFFMNRDSEILYLMKNGKLQGILSIGDLERYFSEDNKECTVNSNFCSLTEIDYKKAELFFRSSKTINEIPVIAKNGELKGIIKKEKSRLLRNDQRNSLQNAKYKKNIWYQRELKRFVEHTEARVFIYDIDSDKVEKGLKDDFDILLKRYERARSTGDYKGMTNAEWKRFLRSEYDAGVSHQMKLEMSKISVKIDSGKSIMGDAEGLFYNYQNGCRITENVPDTADRRIIMYGPCIVAGGYCRDGQTIASYLQNRLNEMYGGSWKVYNRGLCGDGDCLNRAFVETLSGDDIVIIIYPDRWISPELKQNGTISSLTELFIDTPDLTDNLADSVFHCNYIMNEKIADRLYADLCSTGMLGGQKVQSRPSAIQGYYIPWDLHFYFEKYFEKYDLHKGADGRSCGAIVMNCNPFTYGHRYLVEQALERVTDLYLFVVEEDKSYFKFEDRFLMVKQGVADLKNVKVLPSGQYILSHETFSQYFYKDQVQTVESMDYDIQIFGDVVAGKLGIKYRFVGEEPFDKVTEIYNRTMKKILPDFGIEVVEIPRKKSGWDGEIISASLVRKALRENDYKLLQEFCPKSTLDYMTK